MKNKDAFRRRWRELVIVTLVVSNLAVWSLVYAREPGDTLRVHFFDIGQGDAALIVSPTGSKVLIDGGPNKKVLSELGKVLPFGDRYIDVVIATHPDADHIGGLPEVVSRYDVGIVLEPGVESDNDIDDELRRRMAERRVERLWARQGMVMHLGGGAVLRILFPDRDVSSWDPNDASVVARLDYGESSFLFAGDAGLKTEMLLISLDADIDADVLKAGHHGSRTSTSITFATAVEPLWAVISAGKDNRYGHPHQEVLENLEKTGTIILSTAEIGTIVFETDGKLLELK